MLQLRGREIFAAETEAHYACIRSFRVLSDAHFHDFYEFFLITRGELYHLINGQREVLGPGSLVLIRPADRHCYEPVGESECELINLAFSSSTCQAVIGYLGDSVVPESLLTGEHPPRMMVPPDELEQLSHRMKRLGESLTLPGPLWRGEVRSVLAELFVRYFARAKAAPQSALPDWLEQLAQEVRRPENFIGGLERLLALSPVSPEHLSRSVRKHLGKTPTEWVNELRLQYAADLLVGGEQPIVAVSLQAGFDNLSHFYHLFKQQFRLSPAQYRKSARRVVLPT